MLYSCRYWPASPSSPLSDCLLCCVCAGVLSLALSLPVLAAQRLLLLERSLGGSAAELQEIELFTKGFTSDMGAALPHHSDACSSSPAAAGLPPSHLSSPSTLADTFANNACVIHLHLATSPAEPASDDQMNARPAQEPPDPFVRLRNVATHLPRACHTPQRCGRSACLGGSR